MELDNDLVQVTGSIAGFLTTVAFFPQAYKVYKTRDTQAISLFMFIILNIGLSGWIIYGVMLKQLPIIIPNVVTMILALYILVCKFNNHRKS
ncbi:MAG: SemiSWEET transporter [Cytophagaceae bacterium]|nr:SemiSWEET transporter [Cytophagaceae bacterium]